MHELTLNIKGHALTAAMETAMMASGFKLINMEGLFFWMGYLVVCERRWSAWRLRMHWQFRETWRRRLGASGMIICGSYTKFASGDKATPPSLALDVIGARSLYTRERFLKSDSEAKSLETYRLIVRVLAPARNCFGHRWISLVGHCSMDFSNHREWYLRLMKITMPNRSRS